MPRMKEIENVKTGNLFRVPPAQLVVDATFNIRLHDDDVEARIAQYAAMFMSGSRCPPLAVYTRGDEIVVIDGHMRRLGALRAIELGAEIKDVDCVQHVGNDAERVITMICSGSGRTWLPIELADGYRRLRSFGWTEREIAARVGKTEQHVKDVLTLADADTPIQDLVRSGEVSASLATQIVRQDGHKAIDTLNAAVETAKSAGKTKATAKHVSQVRGTPVGGRDIVRAARVLSEEVLRQADSEGVTDDLFDDHLFKISGQLLRALMAN